MGKRILYISYDGLTDPLGQSQVLPYLNGLSAAGYDISIISCEKPEQAGTRNIIEEICRTNNLSWHPIPYTRKPPILSTVKDVRAIRSKAASLHAEQPFDIVHCRSYISALIGLGMKKRLGVKFIFDMRGFWADERVDGGLWNLGNPLYRIVYNYFKRKEKKFLAGADAIVSLTHAAKTEMEQWKLPVLAPVTVIPCCVDTTLFDPATISAATKQQLRKQLNIPAETPILGYVGSVGTWYMLREMLDFFQVYLQQQPDAVLLFVTAEPASLIEQQAAEANIKKEQLRIVKAARKEVPDYISIMHQGLFFIKPAFSKKASSPVKQGEMMAMGLPVICNGGVGDSDHIVKKYNSGALVTGFTSEGYRSGISTLQDTSFDANHIREGAKDYFDLQKGIASYLKIYRELAP